MFCFSWCMVCPHQPIRLHSAAPTPTDSNNGSTPNNFQQNTTHPPYAYLIAELSLHNPFLWHFTNQILILFTRQFWVRELTQHTHLNFTQWTLEHLVYISSETPTRTLWCSTVERFSTSPRILRCLLERKKGKVMTYFCCSLRVIFFSKESSARGQR